ncbi:MAG TPA: flagellar hook-basal body protein [Sphingomonas sp.]|jgi:flagellar basal-body rod protein FlgG|nr:flagellar hook-basal body protein [Sphingomonas sp.]
MAGLVEVATAVMRTAERRLDVVAHNVANISTPGFKRRMSIATSGANVVSVETRNDFAQGKLQATGNPHDLAIDGAGFFKLREGDAIVYSRQGQFRRDVDGTWVTPQGYVLQQAGGGDLIVDSADAVVQPDGMVVGGGHPLARVAVARTGNDAMLSSVGESAFSAAPAAMEDVADPRLRQGMVETSNVSLGDEMTQSMLALRQAESGAKLIQLYDDLMGRAVSAFGAQGK